MNDGIKQAIQAAGGVKPLADMLGLTRQAIYQWRRVPRGWAIEIEEKLGISRHALRPDIWGDK